MIRTMVDALRGEGAIRGKVEGKQETILQVLRLKFGDLLSAVIKRVQAIRESERLDVLLKEVWEANSLKDIRWRGSRERV